MGLEETKNNLNNIGINTSVNFYNQDILDTLKDVWEEKYMGNKFHPLYAPSVNTQEFLDTFGFEKIDGKYPELEGKKIADIGSGFTSLPFELQNSNTKLSLVDPIFGEGIENKLESLNHNIESIEHDIKKSNELIKGGENIIAKKNEELKDYEADYSGKGRAIFNDINTDINDIHENIKKVKKLTEKRKQLKSDLEKWKDLLNNTNTNLELHGAIGENISTIKDDSQDFVFISCVLDKDCVQPELILSEASRILKPDGKIYMIHDKHENLLTFFRKYNIPYKRIDDHYISIINKK